MTSHALKMLITSFSIPVMDGKVLCRGRTVSTKEAHVLTASRNPAAEGADAIVSMCMTECNGGLMEVVSQFRYMDTILTSGCTSYAEVTL